MLIKLKNYKRFQKFIYFGLIISFQILIVFCSFSWAKNVRHLNVQEIVFSTTKIIKADEYSDIFDKLIGSNYNDINLNMLTEELGDHPYVFASRISYHFPGKIYVEIVERKPIAILMKTIMGNGVDFMMHTHRWHGIAPNDEQLNNALNQNPETLGDY